MSLGLIIALLLLAALVLVVAELFLPSGGVLGLMAGVALIAAVVTCFRVDPRLGAGAVLLVALLAMPAFALGVKVWQWSPVGRKMTLKATTSGRSPLDAVAVGSEGVAVSALRPMGEAEFAGQTVQAKSEFGGVEPGTRVRVIAFAENVATVRPLPAAQVS